MGWTRCRSILTTLALAAGLAACGGGTTKTVTAPPPSPSTSPSGGSTAATTTTDASTASGTSGATSAADALAEDRAAEALAQSANTAALDYANDNSGSYAGLTPDALHSAAPSIQIGPGDGNAYIADPGGVAVLDAGAGFTVTATSVTGDTFSIGESATGSSTQTCTGTASAACAAGNW